MDMCWSTDAVWICSDMTCHGEPVRPDQTHDPVRSDHTSRCAWIRQSGPVRSAGEPDGQQTGMIDRRAPAADKRPATACSPFSGRGHPP